MRIEIKDGRVDLSGNTVLESINISITDQSHIAVVGRNGCGKTTLLRVLSGELSLANSEGDDGFMAISGAPVIGTLNQMTFADNSRTLVEEIRSAYAHILELKRSLDEAENAMSREQSEENIARYTTLLDMFTSEGGFYFEKEYEAAIKRFGFTDEEKYRSLSEFSGGQRTKIAFLKLLLSKPELLLLDEPTNHLDIDAVTWLEDYIKNYKKAVVVVSHDRMFLDNTVNEVYEIERGKTTRYVGNYTDFTKAKKERRAMQAKAYSAQQKEIERITATAERFRYKATKAAMAQSKLKMVERMERLDAPELADNRTFHVNTEPRVKSAKEVLKVDELTVGFSAPLATLSFNVYRGDRIGIIGGNGLGKSTLLKTLVGAMPAISGSCRTGAMVEIGYFDQQQAQIKGSESILSNMLSAFPSMNDFEARSALGAFLFSGEDVYKPIDVLSGGERVRLALCKLFYKRPNFLVLDEPTNHMDIIGKETLEDILEQYEGTVIFVSHDRYFTRKNANRLIVFGDGGAQVHERSFDEYMEYKAKQQVEISEPTEDKKAPTQKKSYTTPLKEKREREKAVKRVENRIAALEKEIAEVEAEQTRDENLSDYQNLSELACRREALENELLAAMEEWENVIG